MSELVILQSLIEAQRDELGECHKRIKELEELLKGMYVLYNVGPNFVPQDINEKVCKALKGGVRDANTRTT